MALRKTGGYSRAKGEGLYWESGLAEEKKAGNRGESCPDTEPQKLAQRHFLEQIGMGPELADRFEALTEKGADAEQIRVLRKYRYRLLEEIHRKQQLLDQLDYLIYEIKNHKS